MFVNKESYIDMANTPEELAITKLQKIIEKAVDSEADSITIEYAKEGGLTTTLRS